MAKVAEVLVQTLIAAGVKRRLWSRRRFSKWHDRYDSQERQVDWLHVRHEEVAAFAAGAEAHLTGELAVCAGSCGPGNLHLINGLL